MSIQTYELWNAHDCIRGVFPGAPKSLHDWSIKLQAGINQELQMYT